MPLEPYKTVDVVEASQLGLPPGYWPALVEHNGRSWMRMFYKYSNEVTCEISSVEYLCGREILEIIND